MSGRYFFGRDCSLWQRLQRTTCELILPPHFGQRRDFNSMTNLVRGRVPIRDIPVFRDILEKYQSSRFWPWGQGTARPRRAAGETG